MLFSAQILFNILNTLVLVLCQHSDRQQLIFKIDTGLSKLFHYTYCIFNGLYIYLLLTCCQLNKIKMVLSVRKDHQLIRTDSTDVSLKAVACSTFIINTTIIITTLLFQQFFVQINKLQNTTYFIKQVNKSRLST